MKNDYYNNIGIGTVALGLVLNENKEIELSKLFLIFPLVSHQKLLAYLCHSTTQILSLEKLIVEKISFFSNFNKRYLDSIALTMNALQYLHEMGYIRIEENKVLLIKEFVLDKKMGARAGRIDKASHNISKILESESVKLYLNLRVEL